MTARQFVYFHGQPGAPAELGLVWPDGGPGVARLFVPDRARDRPDLAIGPYLDRLAATIAQRFSQGPIGLVGFSLGGFVATEVALRLEQPGIARDISLDLISTAAPLGHGDFLPDMAGGAVFALARRAPRLFAALTLIQGVLARRAPGLLFGQIFAAAAGADADLARTPGFQAALQAILAHSLADGAEGYRREILGYVAQGPERLATLRAPITLWHGDCDNWAPPAMARAVVAQAPATRRLRAFPGLSHYSTLQAALGEICKDLG